MYGKEHFIILNNKSPSFRKCVNDFLLAIAKYWWLWILL